ncbi:hypothetical protein D3C85_1910200 [compost metagenome]
MLQLLGQILDAHGILRRHFLQFVNLLLQQRLLRRGILIDLALLEYRQSGVNDGAYVRQDGLDGRY